MAWARASPRFERPAAPRPARTQMKAAKAGEVTPAMARVAEREGMDAETVRSEVARGRLIIPANVRHLAGSLAAASVVVMQLSVVTCLGLAFFLGLEAPRWWQTSTLRHWRPVPPSRPQARLPKPRRRRGT